MLPRVKAGLYNDLQALVGHDLPAVSPYSLSFFPCAPALPPLQPTSFLAASVTFQPQNHCNDHSLFLENVFPKIAASSYPLAALPMTRTLKTLFITANAPSFRRSRSLLCSAFSHSTYFAL